MFVHYRTLGVILKKEGRREADQVFTILTKDFGKLKVLGRAIRKIKSKLRAGAQIFYLSEIEFIQGKAYKTLTDATLIERFPKLRKDLNKLRITSKIAEVVDELIRGEEADEEIWRLILETFKRLEKCSSPSSCFLIYHYFLWNFLSILGYRLELKHCPLCQKNLTPTNIYFSPEQGGIVCNNCLKEKAGKKINSEVVKILRLLIKRDWSVLSRLKIKPEHEKDLKNISEDYLSYFSNT